SAFHDRPQKGLENFPIRTGFGRSNRFRFFFFFFVFFFFFFVVVFFLFFFLGGVWGGGGSGSRRDNSVFLASAEGADPSAGGVQEREKLRSRSEASLPECDWLWRAQCGRRRPCESTRSARARQRFDGWRCWRNASTRPQLRPH